MEDNILFKDVGDSLLSDYILVIDDFIDNEVCEKTVDHLNSLKNTFWKNEIVYDFPNEITDSRYNSFINNNLIQNKINFLTHQRSVESRSEENLFSIFEKIVYDALYKYVFELYNFDYYKKWYNFSIPRFNKYESGMFMKKHCDNFRTMFDGAWKGVPIYSVIGFLNDTYSGGELVFWDDLVVENKKGRIIVFPSNFLYPHKINEVKDGIKYSFSSYSY